MAKRDFIKLLVLPFISLPVFAEMPGAGLYGGALIGITWSSPISDPLIISLIDTERQRDGFFAQLIQRIFLQYRSTLSGRDFELNYATFGQIGAQIGYRFESLRLEGQFFYNTSPYRKLIFHGPLLDFDISANSNQNNYITGETNTAAGMLNIYYDFIHFPVKFINITPFVGIGGGYANVSNNLKLYIQGNALNNNPIAPSGSHFAGQLMTGLLYFIDEFSTIGLDYRYFTTASQTVSIAAENTTFRNQIQSVNLTYNGSFNFG